MREFIFRGTMLYRGVSFLITAATEEEARAKADRGEYDSYESLFGEVADWSIEPDSIVENA